MARRYLGKLANIVVYHDRGHYRASVIGGGLSWKGTVGAPAAGFGPGIAYDSDRAYDQIAQAAVSFALDEKPDLEEVAFAGPHGGQFRRPGGKTYARLYE
jgi:hypothetical protein